MKFVFDDATNLQALKVIEHILCQLSLEEILNLDTLLLRSFFSISEVVIFFKSFFREELYLPQA
jgi:hypothetical protein